MSNRSIYGISLITIILSLVSCKMVKEVERSAPVVDKSVPAQFADTLHNDSSQQVTINWKTNFNDPQLTELIDLALVRNQEVRMMQQEIQFVLAELRGKKGEILPQAGVRLGAGMDKFGEYTRDGAVESQLEVEPGKHFPHPMGDFLVGGYFSWEIDIWRKLRNGRDAQAARYLASQEGRNFVITELVSEVASTYYELIALDRKLEIVQRNILLQTEALEVVKKQMEAARVTQLAVNRFQAQLLNTQNLQYAIQQEITENENKLNFLLGRYPQPIARNSSSFKDMNLSNIYVGVPSQLLLLRPDVRQAEQELLASQLEVKVAKANFLPQFSLNASVGMNAYNPKVWFNPQSLLFNLVGDLMVPLINRNGLNAQYLQANAKRNQLIVSYEKTVLNACKEVVNQLAMIDNSTKSFQTKSAEVDLLYQAVRISGELFTSARADYMEVLLTQRETIESEMELVEIKLNQLQAKVGLYKALGGGW